MVVVIQLSFVIGITLLGSLPAWQLPSPHYDIAMKRKELSKEEIEALVHQAQKGSVESFETLYDYFFEKIYRHVGFRVDPEYVEDVVSDIFLKVVQSLPKYAPKKSASFAAWVFRIAHNQIVDYYRKQKEILIQEFGGEEDGQESFFDTFPDEDTPTPDVQVQQMLEAKKIREALQHVRPAHREILELKYLEDFTNKEIAQITGKSEGNVRIIQLRALKELRTHLEKYNS